MNPTKWKCASCATLVGTEFLRCPVCHGPPPAPESVSTGKAVSRALKYSTYERVPWYRREPGFFAFLPALVFTPVLVALCVICLTGDVYTKGRNADGTPRVWGRGNKVAAVLILLIQGSVTWAAWRIWMRR